MKREIIFRGKRLEDGKWIYGYFFEQNMHDGLRSYIRTLQADRFGTDFAVDPATVGQYTGRTDKNGKKIFEGDIMAIKTRISGLYDYRRVQYNDIKGAWTAVADHICHIWSFLYELNDDYIVIGNIHDNPELLKGGEE